MRALTSRLRALERSQRAYDTRRPTPEEMRSEAQGAPVRQVVADLAGRMREFARRLDPWPDLADADAKK